jgi:hypothetical protein
MDRKLHVDTLISIPTLKLTCFVIPDRQKDGQTDRWMETLIWGGLRNLSVSPGRHWIWGYWGGSIEGALKTVDLEKILSRMYLVRTFLEIYI